MSNDERAAAVDAVKHKILQELQPLHPTAHAEALRQLEGFCGRNAEILEEANEKFGVPD